MQTINDQSFTVAVKAAMIKGLVHPKMKILSLITPLMLLQTHKTFVHLQNTNEDVFDEIWELSDPP